MELKSRLKSKLLIAGGGTGGHVLAGVAIAEQWENHFGQSARLLFVGSYGGIEEKIIPRTQYALKLLRVGSFNRVSLKKRVKTLFQLPYSFFQSLWILWKWKPDFVLGVGGYSSGPVVLAAWFLNVFCFFTVEIAILEQNSIPGMTNRLLSKFSNRVFTAFPGMEAQFPGNSVLQTGNPIRSSMRRMISASRSPFQIFIFGGSGGAMGINSLVLESFPFLTDLKDQVSWVHQTGEKDYSRVLEGYLRHGVKGRIEKFIHDMPTVYQGSSLLICRAGASTLAEIAAIGRAAVLIPLPTAANNHQEANALVFVKDHAALYLRQSESSGEILAKTIRKLILNSDNLIQMEQAVTKFYFPNAARNIVQVLLS